MRANQLILFSDKEYLYKNKSKDTITKDVFINKTRASILKRNQDIHVPNTHKNNIAYLVFKPEYSAKKTPKKKANDEIYVYSGKSK